MGFQARLPAQLASAAIQAGLLEQVPLTLGETTDRIDLWLRADAGMPVMRLADDLARRLASESGSNG